jgi:hypothetical protein
MPFVSPYRFTNMDELLKERLGKPEVSSEGNPKKFIDKSDPRYQESIYAEPDVVPSMDPGNLGGTVAKVGGGIKETLGKIVAGPWRSRTLETIEKNPKMPSSASPQTWLSKLKGAGLPKDEVAVAENFLGTADPKSKLSREQLNKALSSRPLSELNTIASAKLKKELDYTPGSAYPESTIDAARRRLYQNDPEYRKAYDESKITKSLNYITLPKLGVTKTTLGGAEWEAGQKRLDEIPRLVNQQVGQFHRKFILVILSGKKYSNRELHL